MNRTSLKAAAQLPSNKGSVSNGPTRNKETCDGSWDMQESRDSMVVVSSSLASSGDRLVRDDSVLEIELRASPWRSSPDLPDLGRREYRSVASTNRRWEE
jgi:hypothetical protein